MKKLVVIGLVSCCLLGLLGFAVAAEAVWQDIGGGNTDIRTVLVSPQNAKIIYAGSKSGVLKSEDSGKSWRNVLLLGGQNRAVNFLCFGANYDSVYAASSAGLYYSQNSGRNWERIFQGKSNLEKESTVVTSLSYALLLGTKSGLFVSIDRGRSWHKAQGELGSSNILAIAYHPKEPDSIYVAAVDGVFKSSNRLESWEKIFLVNPVENGQEQEETVDDQNEETKFSDIRYLSIDSNTLYLATQRGVSISQDKGKTWRPLPSFGLLSREVNFLLVSLKGDIYAANRLGIFTYNQDRWQEISLGLAANQVKSLALDSQDNLYAACDKGLFKTNIKYLSSGDSENIIAVYYKDEPEISEIQQMAIKYAEVEPEKIIRWRKQAAKKAFLPKFTAGINRDTSDLWHWESGSSTKTCDDVLIRGRDTVGWDLTLTWDLGEIIWNADQTNIDVRSRLMVELRQDILDEVTKLYFERIRLKMEIDNLSIEDRKKRLEKELRLQELTASLNALTGGYFSQQLNKGSQKL